MLLELSPRCIELLDTLHLYWDHWKKNPQLKENTLTDAWIIENALLVYIRWLADDSSIISTDEIIRLFRNYFSFEE